MLGIYHPGIGRHAGYVPPCVYRVWETCWVYYTLLTRVWEACWVYYPSLYHPGYTTLVYIYHPIPLWVYHLPPAYPVYRSSCPSMDALPGEEALGSNREKEMGMRRIEPS